MTLVEKWEKWKGQAMTDLVLIIVLIALTAVSLLYIAGCDRLRSEDAETGTAGQSSVTGKGG
jgi:hypothetical protein